MVNTIPYGKCMKLLIKTPFELDVELVDMMPKYLKFNSNWVSIQTIETTNEEMIALISLLNFSSHDFISSQIVKLDDLTLIWG
jgi:hypothetical protein